MTQRRKFGIKAEAALKDMDSKTGRDRALSVIRPQMLAMAQKYPGLRERLRSVKEAALQNMSALVEQAKTRLEENGCRVFIARDEREAREYIINVVDSGPVIKSKSNVGKEIGLVEALGEKGVQVVETDLGDWINQLLGSTASHPLAPAIHVPIARISRAFSQLEGRELPEDVNVLVGVARKQLRGIMETARYGITGANAIAADTGAIILMENEGNIRAVTSLPATHIVVAGINKIVPTFEDGALVIQSASVYGAGQEFGTYMSAISGPAPLAEGQRSGPREVHVVLLDNGRNRAIAEGFGEAFYCINCGSCHNFCPVYGAIGNSFGKKYIGGIGVVQTALTRSLAEAEEAGLSACLGCGTCRQACPSKIDTPAMISRLRSRLLADRGLPPVKKYLLQRILPSQKRLEQASRWAARAAGSLLRPLADGRGVESRIAPAGLAGRMLPGPVRQSFLMKAPGIAAVDRPLARVGFYAGCLVNAAYTGVGQATLRILTQNRVEVLTPRGQQCCGLPLLAAGDHDGARALAKRNIDLLTGLKVDKVVNVCATCGHALISEYPRLFMDRDDGYYAKALRLAGMVTDISVFLAHDLNWEPQIAGTKPRVKVTYHDPCHLRAGQGITEEPRRILTALDNADYVEMEEAGRCCGFGGAVSFDHYPLTRAVTGVKVEKIIATGADVVCTSCPGCMANLGDGLYRAGRNIPVRHLVELLAGWDQP